MYNSLDIIVTLHTPRTLLTVFPVPCQADGIVSLEPQNMRTCSALGCVLLENAHGCTGCIDCEDSE